MKAFVWRHDIRTTIVFRWWFFVTWVEPTLGMRRGRRLYGCLIRLISQALEKFFSEDRLRFQCYMALCNPQLDLSDRVCAARDGILGLWMNLFSCTQIILIYIAYIVAYIGIVQIQINSDLNLSQPLMWNLHKCGSGTTLFPCVTWIISH